MHIEIAEGDIGLRSVLILEDEALVAMMMETVIQELGVETIETYACCGDARETAERGDIDCAVLDVQVRDGMTTPIADLLMLRGIPVIFSTGSTVDALPERFRHLPMINKPFSDEGLKAAVLDAVAGQRTIRPGLSDASAPRVATFSATD